MTRIELVEDETNRDRGERVATALALLKTYEAMLAEINAELRELRSRLDASIEIDDVLAIEFQFRNFISLLRRKKPLLLCRKTRNRRTTMYDVARRFLEGMNVSEKGRRKVTTALEGDALQIVRRWAGERSVKETVAGLLVIADRVLTEQQDASQ